MTNSFRLFGVAFLLALISQGLVWSLTDFVDQTFWLERVENFAEDMAHGQFVFDIQRHAVHPGTPVLTIAAVVRLIGFPLDASLKTAVALLNAAIIALIIVVLKRLRPHSLWWLGAGVFLLFNYQYLPNQSNPLDVIVASLIVLSFMILLYRQENGSRPSPLASWGLALCLGAAAATRLHVTLMIAPLLLIALAYVRTLRVALWTAAGTVASFVVFTPFILFSPWRYLNAAVVQQLVYFAPETSSLSESYTLSLAGFVLSAPLATAGVLLTFIFLLLRRSLPLPVSFVALVGGSSVVVLTVYLFSNLQSFRYVYPLVLLWESLLPLYVERLMKLIRLPAQADTLAKGSFLLILVTYIFLFFYILLLPTPVSI